jgi:hypothetical protein
VTAGGGSYARRVEVRIGDAPWQPAALAGDRHRHSWQRWQFAARIPGPGSTTIRARATDLSGRAQPDQPQWNPLGYANNAIHEVHLAVAEAPYGQGQP